MVLCGGKGERLRPLTDSLPKALVPLRGRPILSYVLAHLESYGITNVVIAAGHLQDKIEEFCARNCRNLNVKVSGLGDVDIIERIKGCSDQIKGDFMVLYGDTIADVNLDHLQEFHFSHSGQATITLWPFRSPFGLFELDETSSAIAYREKPVLSQSINIGYFYYEHEVFSWMDGFSIYSEFLAHLVNHRKLKGFMHRGIHLTVNNLRELEEAEKTLDELKM